MKFRMIRNAALSLTAFTALTLSGGAQTGNTSGKTHTETKSEQATEARQSISDPDSSAPRNWTNDQIITATVHQAWVLGGKDEAGFFEIIKELAEISANNRNLRLPESAAAGRRAGAYIKTQAKLDHDQLLYAIVDKAVRMTGTKMPSTNATASK